jgi:hypothetical protein
MLDDTELDTGYESAYTRWKDAVLNRSFDSTVDFDMHPSWEGWRPSTVLEIFRDRFGDNITDREVLSFITKEYHAGNERAVDVIDGMAHAYALSVNFAGRS